MAAKDKISPDQFSFRHEHDTGRDEHALYAEHKPTGRDVGYMNWAGNRWGSPGHLWEIEVDEDFQRKGVATSMWNHAKNLAKTNPSISHPVHSDVRTPEGAAWAKSTGDFVPVSDMDDED